MNPRAIRLFGFVASILLASMAACSGLPAENGDNGAETKQAHFLVDVEVRSGVGGQIGSPLRDGVSISLRRIEQGDVVGNGSAMDEEIGWFRVEKQFEQGESSPPELLLVVEAEGHASRFIRVPPMTELESPQPVVVRALLYPTEQFEVANLFRLGMVDQRISVTLPPEDAATGHACLFDPIRDAQGMPGALLDSRGRHIGTGVFAAVTLDDGAGGRVSEATESTVLRMRVPRDLWPSLVAIEPGDIFIEPGDIFIEPGDIFIEPGDIFVPSNDIAISVAIYGFDPAAGSWSFSSVGQLQTAAGQPVMMSELDSIRSGEFPEALFASAQVQHFSYWGMAWPIEGDACLTGVLTDSEGNPVAGKTVTAHGVDRPISTSPVVTDAEGRFCLPVPPPGSGPDYRVRLTIPFTSVALDGAEPSSFQSFDLLEVTVTRDAAGTCGADGCLELDLPPLPEWMVSGSRELDGCGDAICLPNGEVGPEICEVTVFLQHDHYDAEMNLIPADASMSVSARLPAATQSMIDLCATGCTLVADVPTAGELTLRVPKGETVELTGNLRFEDWSGQMLRSGTLRFENHCSGDRMVVDLSEGFLTAEAAVMTNSHSEVPQISWSVYAFQDQGLPADFIEVRSKIGELKWAIGAEGEDRPVGFVDYLKPETAMQLYPRDGSNPEPLAEGDVISVWASGSAGDLAVSASGSFTFTGR